MKWRKKKKAGPEEFEPMDREMVSSMAPPNSIVIVGAGNFAHDIITLLKGFPEYEITGILDPSPSLKEQSISGIPILGWLGDIPENTGSAVIGTPSSPGAFDREAVFHILFKQNISLPILKSPSSQCAEDVVLHKATVLLNNSTVQTGAKIGMNCLLGPESTVCTGTDLQHHSVLRPGEKTAISGDRKTTPVQPKSLKSTLASEKDSIQEIIKKINWASMEIMLITDESGKLVGTVTDGDIRRGILAGLDLSQPVTTICNPNPVTASLETSHLEMLELMQKHTIRHIPVLDKQDRPVRLEVFDSILDNISDRDAIVMAGGLGSRLMPLTQETPKPLLSIAGQPILDHILGSIKKSGLNDVVISVNYRGEQIMDHVGDGEKHDLSVAYVSERDRLGTAGALSLITPRPKLPFLVMNGDLLTELNFSRILAYQKEHNYDITMCVKQKKIEIPYGVVEIEDGQVSSLKEKPVHSYLFNAGIYVIDPACIDMIPKNKYFDMTDLIGAVMNNGGTVGAFPVIEYWRDIGTPKDLNEASAEHRAISLKTA